MSDQYPDRPVQFHLNKIEDEIRSMAEVLFSEVDDKKSLQWNEGLSEICEKFEHDLESCGFSEESRFENRRSAWVAVNKLRTAVAKNVYDALAELLSESLHAGNLQNRLTEQTDRLNSLANTLPEVIDRPEPGALFATRETDSGLIRLRKIETRALRAVRAVAGKKEYRQNVFVRQLAEHHLKKDVFPVIISGLEKILNDRNASVITLERALTEWTHVILDAERELDEAVFHIPESDGIPERSGIPESDGIPERSGIQELRETTDVSKNKSSMDNMGSVDAESGGIDDESSIAGYREAVSELRTANSSLKNAFSQAVLDTDETRDTEFQITLEAGLVRLRDGVQSSDTFMADVVNRIEDKPDVVDGSPKISDATVPIKIAPRLISWIDEAIDRLRFCNSLFQVRALMTVIQDELIDDIIRVSIVPISNAHEQSAGILQKMHEEADRVFDQAVRFSDYSGLEQRLGDWQEKGKNSVLEGVVGATGRLRVKDGIEEAGRRATTRCTEMLTGFERNFSVHNTRGIPEKLSETKTDSYEIVFREYLEVGLDESLESRIESAPSHLLSKIKDVLKGAAEIPDVLDFNFGEAIDELRDKGESTDVRAARELVLNGMARSSELLLAEKNRLASPLYNLVDELFSTFEESWRRIHDRARVENQVRKYILGARSSLEDQKRRVSDTLLNRIREAAVGSRRFIRIARKRLNDLVRMGRAAVGESDQQELTFQETIEALSALDELLEAVPGVYRRLFSFNPVTDPDLLVGREGDRLVFAKHVQKWRKGVTQSILLYGAPSSGRSSLLNVLTETVFRNADVCTLVLKERVLDEARLTNLLVNTLELELPVRNQAATLDDLTALILSAPPSDALKVCIVDHIEHLYLRGIGGSSTAARLLMLMSRTDSRVLWLCTISEFGLQYLKANETAALALVRKHQLSTLDREDMEKLIMNRHRKSGLKVHFEQREVINPLLRRRLKKAASVEDEQVILREIYFDRLSAQCGQNIMLALYYWIRSITVTEDEAGVLVAPLDPIKFAFLGAFSLRQAIALKALLDHASLTVGEFSTISQTDEEDSLAVFESLGNALLIEALDGDSKPDHFHFLTVEHGIRYRIRPLTVHPIIQFLRGKNIVN